MSTKRQNVTVNWKFSSKRQQTPYCSERICRYFLWEKRIAAATSESFGQCRTSPITRLRREIVHLKTARLRHSGALDCYPLLQIQMLGCSYQRQLPRDTDEHILQGDLRLGTGAKIPTRTEQVVTVQVPNHF